MLPGQRGVPIIGRYFLNVFTPRVTVYRQDLLEARQDGKEQKATHAIYITSPVHPCVVDA